MKEIGNGEGQQAIFVFAGDYDEEQEGVMFIHQMGGDVAFALNKEEAARMLEDMIRETGEKEIRCFELVKVSLDN